MITDEDTVLRAVQSYAVLLNRAQWLDDSRVLMQQTIWTRLVKRRPGRGTVLLDHFERAMEELLVEHRPLDVVVPQIIARACEICAVENEQVAQMYAAWEAGTPILLGETTRARATGDLDELDRVALHASRLLAASPLDGSEVEAMLGEIQVEVDAARDAIRAGYEGPTELENADAVVSEWLTTPPVT